MLRQIWIRSLAVWRLFVLRSVLVLRVRRRSSSRSIFQSRNFSSAFGAVFDLRFLFAAGLALGDFPFLAQSIKRASRIRQGLVFRAVRDSVPTWFFSALHRSSLISSFLTAGKIFLFPLLLSGIHAPFGFAVKKSFLSLLCAARVGAAPSGLVYREQFSIPTAWTSFPAVCCWICAADPGQRSKYRSSFCELPPWISGRRSDHIPCATGISFQADLFCFGFSCLCISVPSWFSS
jgi:hypothetical protein